MLVNLNTGPDGTRRELILQSQGYASDRLVLEKLVALELASGFGRHADTGALLHVTVELAPQSGESPAESAPVGGIVSG